MTEANEYRPTPEIAPGEPGWERPTLPDYVGNEEASRERWAEILAELPNAAERRRKVELENPRPTAVLLHRLLKR